MMHFDALINTSATLAYIGPGGGIALLGPLIGVIVAVVGALAMVAIWPLRVLWKRLHQSKSTSQKTT
jgi:hypothetical protein